jgi:murein DD-endopeptidase MepM/ murein hydrolase activator NlpD
MRLKNELHKFITGLCTSFLRMIKISGIQISRSARQQKESRLFKALSACGNNMRRTSHHSGISVGVPLILFTLMISFAFVYRVYAENTILTQQISSLTVQVKDYTSLTAQQLALLDNLKSFESDATSKISEYNEKYKTIADRYIDSRLSSSFASRATGDPGQSFITDINELKSLLDGINTLNATTNTGELKFNDAESRIRAFLDGIPTYFPTYGTITQYFGSRSQPHNYSYIEHSGVDIPASYGQEIRAAASGIVVQAAWSGGYGNCVVIDHLNGIKTYYAHCSSILVAVGQHVEKGEVVSLIGSTGNSTGPHLHFEVYLNGTAVDPLNFLQ